MPENTEHQLWCAVLDQLLTDATNPRVGTPSARRDRDSARSYLTTRSRDLEEVCSLAGLEVCRAMAAFKIKIDEATQHDNADETTTSGRRTRLQPNALLNHNGRSLTVNQWAAATGLSPAVIYRRLQSGMTVDDALTKPMRQTRHRGEGQNFKQSIPDRSFSISETCG